MRVDIAIITTREDEYRAVANRLKAYQLEPERGSSGRTYAFYSVATRVNRACAVALVRGSEQGPEVAQQLAGDAMRDLDPQIVLVVGIAGGIPNNEFTLGDVIISSRIDNFIVNAYNQDEITFDGKSSIDPFVSDITGTRLFAHESYLDSWNESDSIGIARPTVDLSWVQSNLYGDTRWNEDVLASFSAHFGPAVDASRPSRFKPGRIASSGSLMKNTRIPATWLQSARSILAVEMESAGVVQAAQQIGKQYPVMAIRGISDIIGLKRDERWTPYACQAAASFTCAFIKAAIIEPRASSVPKDEKPSTGHRLDRQKIIIPDRPPGKITAPLDLFISYSAEDEKFKKELDTHLVLLKRGGIIRPWNSLQVEPGLEWQQEVATLIDSSQIIILLISQSFLADDQLFEQEMHHAMERHESGQARVVPILVRATTQRDLPINKLQALPRDHKPVAAWKDHDEIWVKIAQDIWDICNKLLGSQNE